MLLIHPDRNLVLTGYIGPNQPTVGQQIAERLKLRFINVDLQIETRLGMTLDAARDRYGETHLKMLEAEVMSDILLHRSAVIRISGQTLLRGDYAERLGQTGPIICLCASLDSLLSRLHLSLGARYHNPQERALAVGHLKREWAVRKLPGLHELDCTYLNEAETVNTVIEVWQAKMLNGHR
jgi:shikimate kinase